MMMRRKMMMIIIIIVVVVNCMHDGNNDSLSQDLWLIHLQADCLQTGISSGDDASIKYHHHHHQHNFFRNLLRGPLYSYRRVSLQTEQCTQWMVKLCHSRDETVMSLNVVCKQQGMTQQWTVPDVCTSDLNAPLPYSMLYKPMYFLNYKVQQNSDPFISGVQLEAVF